MTTNEKRRGGARLKLLPVIAVAAGLGTPAWAASNEELAALIRAQRAELQALRKEVDALKKQRPTSVVVADPSGKKPGKVFDPDRFVEKGRRPKSFKIPGTEFDVRIGGFAKADVISRVSGSSTGAEDLFVVPAINTRGQRAGDDRTRVHGRESRFNIDVAGPTRFGNFRSFVEGDFFGAGGNEIISNSDAFRLRHAFGELGPLTAGQTWTTFMDVSALPNSLDFEGPGAESFIRQGLVRYTHNFGNGLTIAGAIENPESRVITAGAATASSFRDTSAPDFVLRARYEQPWGHVQVAGVASSIAGPSGTGSEVGFGANISGKINLPFIGPKDNIVFQANYSHGTARYMLDTAVASGSAAVRPGTTSLEVIDAVGGYLAYQHFWTPEIRSSIAGSVVAVDTPAFLPATAFKTSYYAFANVIWSPFPEVDLGVEAQWGLREDQDGKKGASTRLQSSAIFRF